MSYRLTDLLKTFGTEGRQKTSTRFRVRNCKKTSSILSFWMRGQQSAPHGAQRRRQIIVPATESTLDLKT